MSKRNIQVTIGSVSFVAVVDYHDTADWYIEEIYPDVDKWPYVMGLYDLLSEWTIERIENYVDYALREPEDI
jgi:hypothetical protein